MLNKVGSLLHYVSDLHLEKGFARHVKISKPYIILAGDIGNPRHCTYVNMVLGLSDYFEKVFVLSGNHEYDNAESVGEVDDCINTICSMRNNLFFLQKDTHVLCKEDNLILAGCTLWSTLPKLKHQYHLDHQKWLKETIEYDPVGNYVVATHHCPLFECLNVRYHNKTANYFATDQSEIVKKDNLLMWIHGHSHMNKDINVYGKWIVSNQYGNYEYPLKGFKY